MDTGKQGLETRSAQRAFKDEIPMNAHERPVFPSIMQRSYCELSGGRNTTIPEEITNSACILIAVAVEHTQSSLLLLSI